MLSLEIEPEPEEKVRACLLESRHCAQTSFVLLMVLLFVGVFLSSVSNAAMSSSHSTVTTYRTRLKIGTTSDWTTVRLLSGGAWQNFTVISVSENALGAGFNGEALYLRQPIDGAEAAGRVELVVEATITGLDPAEKVVFEIDRGYLGATQVEIMDNRGGVPVTIAACAWNEIRADGPNTKTFEVPSAAFLDPNSNEYIVIAQLNFWYYGPGQWGGFEDDYGNRVTPLTPLLGETYRASDPAVVYQQIEWAAAYGVDAFSIEWTTPRGVGCCGSMEDTLDDVFLKSPNIHKVRWAIFYDFVLRLDQTKELNIDVSHPIDFDQPAVYNTFVADFVHFAKKYFGHPQYLTIDGRPVIYIWATNSYIGNLAGAIKEARAKVAALGYDVFIVGDEVQADLFDPEHALLFDGSSTFTFLIPGLEASWADVGEAAVAVDGVFQRWSDQLAGLKVVGREEFVNVQPAWAPQYDDRLIQTGQEATYVPATSKDQVQAMATVARKYAQPVGNTGKKFVWLNTWNNWAETTTVEPTANFGPKYPAGNYQFDMLEVVREVFGGETFFNPEVVPAAPHLQVKTSGLEISLSWDSIGDAVGYLLYYAPYPYTGPETIGSIDMGLQTSVVGKLWSGAAFYVAIQAYNDTGNSGFSNVERFILSRISQ